MKEKAGLVDCVVTMTTILAMTLTALWYATLRISLVLVISAYHLSSSTKTHLLISPTPNKRKSLQFVQILHRIFGSRSVAPRFWSSRFIIPAGSPCPCVPWKTRLAIYVRFIQGTPNHVHAMVYWLNGGHPIFAVSSYQLIFQRETKTERLPSNVVHSVLRNAKIHSDCSSFKLKFQVHRQECFIVKRVYQMFTFPWTCIQFVMFLLGEWLKQPLEPKPLNESAIETWL